MSEQPTFYGPAESTEKPMTTPSFAIASLALGGVAFLLCWIPFVGVLSMPVSALGFASGLVGLAQSTTRKWHGFGFCVGGLAVSAFAFSIPLVMVKAAADVLEATEGRASREAVPAYTPEPGFVVPHVDAAEPAEPAPPQAIKPTARRASLKESLVLDGVKVRVEEVMFDHIPLETFAGDKGSSQNKLLAVILWIENVDQKKKRDYSGWCPRFAVFDKGLAQLTDENNNTYKRVTFTDSTIRGRVEDNQSLYPGKPVVDILVFEPPLDSAQVLNLDLPGEAVGVKDGVYRFALTRTAWAP